MTSQPSILPRVLAALLCLAAGGMLARGAGKMERVNDDSGQITVLSPDLLVADSIMQFAADARKKLTPILGLKTPDASHITIQTLPAEKGKPWPLPSIGVVLRGGHLDFSITLRVPGPHATEEFLRVFTEVCLYQKIVSDSHSFHAGDSLPALPLWLSEGTLQILLSEENRDWRLVIDRARKTNKAPTLDAVMAWQDLSSETLERMWQQAFSYCLVSSLTRPGSREGFQQWLTTADSQKPVPFSSVSALLADEFAWRAQLERTGGGSREILYSWEETANALNKAMPITLLATGSEKEVTTTIDALDPYKTHPGLAAAVNDKLTELTDIDLKASFLWHQPIACYRAALMTIAHITPPPELQKTLPGRGSKNFGKHDIPVKADYADYVSAASEQVALIQKLHEQVNDYLNWVVVTKSAGEQGSAFASYYELQKKLGDFQPRQKDNLSRAILKIEKENEVPLTGG